MHSDLRLSETASNVVALNVDPDHAILELHASAMEGAANPMFLAERSGAIRWVNHAFELLYGYTLEEIKGKTPRVLKSGRQTSDFYQELWRTISAGSVWRGQLTNRKRGGELFDVEQTITPLRVGSSRVTHFLAVYEDITQRLRSEQSVVHMAMHDSLTGLPNRGQFLRRAEIAFSRARRIGKSYGVIMIDLDHFKAVNDTLGHSAGDDLLIQVASRLQATVRDTDVVARLSGDEFSVLIEDLSRPDQVVELAQRLLQVIRKPFDILGRPIEIGASMGIAVSSATDVTPAQLLKNADLAMYKAKGAGRGQFQFFDSSMDAAARLRYSTETALREALRDDKLYLVFQPQVDLDDGRIIGAEALLRWTDEKRGPVPPHEFVTLAEQTGMIFALNDWVVRHALKQISAWINQGVNLVPISVNISAGQFVHAGYADPVIAMLKQYDVPPNLLKFEITESMILYPGSAVNDNLISLSQAGIRIGIDDFGTGFSSLSSLRDFAIDHLKLDISFVRGIGHSEREERLLRAIVGLAHNMGLHLVAEGVERPDQVRFLLGENCKNAQGFLYSEGVLPEEFAKLLAGGSISPVGVH